MNPFDELTHVDATAPIPSVETIRKRGRAIVRGRRTRRGAVVGALAVVLTVGGLGLPRLGGSGPDVQASGGFLGIAPASASDGAQCNMGYGDWVERADWADHADVTQVASLVAADGIASMYSVGVHSDTGRCAVLTPAAVLYDTHPVRGITVWRDVANPYGDKADLRPQRVRGVTGLTTDLDDGEHVLSWRDGDGIRWLVESSGLSVDDTVGVLDRLTFTDGQVESSSVPAGFASAQVAPTTTHTVRTWEVTYGTKVWDDERISLVAKRLTTPPEVFAARDAAGVRFATVEGATAVFTPMPGGGGSLYWVRDGVEYQLTTLGSLSQLRQLAEHVEHVAVDDPRLDGVPDPRDVVDLGH
jgi:hypothetical protein